MTRRSMTLLFPLALGFLAVPRTADAQLSRKMPLVGVLFRRAAPGLSDPKTVL